MFAISSSMIERVALGTVLKSVGSFARLGDIKQTGDKEVIMAGRKREASLLGFTALVTLGLEGIMKNIKPMLKELPGYAKYKGAIKAVPLLIGYILAEGASKRFAGLGKEFKEMANHKTVNVQLDGKGSKDAHPIATINFTGSAAQNYNSPVVLQAAPVVQNPFANAARTANTQYASFY